MTFGRMVHNGGLDRGIALKPYQFIHVHEDKKRLQDNKETSFDRGCRRFGITIVSKMLVPRVGSGSVVLVLGFKVSGCLVPKRLTRSTRDPGSGPGRSVNLLGSKRFSNGH